MTEDKSSRKNNNSELLQLTVEVAVAYLKNNEVPVDKVPEFMSMIHDSLNKINGIDNEQEHEPLKPAISIRKSITPDYIICLEDGKKLKMLKRHIRTAYNLSPEEYRAKWNLPSDYPMVAPSYAAQRSEFAKKIGLGRSSSKRRNHRFKMKHQ